MKQFKRTKARRLVEQSHYSLGKAKLDMVRVIKERKGYKTSPEMIMTAMDLLDQVNEHFRAASLTGDKFLMEIR